MKSVLFLLVGLLLAQPIRAVEIFGTVEAVSGEATLTDATGASKRVTSGLKVLTGQSIQTEADGEVHIVTEDSGLIALRPNSSFRVDRYQAKGEPTDETVFSLFKGAMRSITGWIAKRNASAYRLNTPSTTIGVRGTDHETTVIESPSGDDLPGTFDTVYEGATVLQTARGEVQVRAGEHAYAPRDGSAAPRLLARQPGFMQRRALRLEQRIQQRKEGLSQRIRQQLENRPDMARDLPAGQRPDIRPPRENGRPHAERRRPPRERRAP
jgi:hypothetical protein